MRAFIILLSITVALMAINLKSHQYSGVAVGHEDENFVLEREISPKCLNIPILSGVIWEGSYAYKSVPKECKATFVTSAGQIQPMQLHPKVETYGELEVLDFLKQMQGNDLLVLVDSRTEPWFQYRTIPGAINIPQAHISKIKSLSEEYKNALDTLGIKEDNNLLDFSNAKTIVLFCNGSWCGQSPSMIKELILLGYPSEKIKWYRGGMHDWLALSMTSTNKTKE